jgi:alkanesulfonate monooxygenase SsuD/methylene tetrahydromethanopterin reductase-like flavin-dependent oxidoreductase (luciferase family)
VPRKLVGFNIRYKGDRPPTHEDFKTLLEIARDADKHYDEGLYYLAVPEFFARRDPNRLHSVPYLAAIATVTENVRFGPNVMEVPLLHPKHVADISASLDIMSNGRFILGVGVGIYEPSYETFGVPWKERGKVLDEALEVIKRLWTEPVVNYTGKYFKIVNDCSPPCIQKPHVPIWVGGGSKAARRRAAQYGNEWAPSWWFPGIGEEGEVQVLDRKIKAKESVGVEPGFTWESALEELRMYCEKFGRILVLGRPPRDPKEVGFNISGFNININPDMEAAVEEAKYFWTDVRKGRTQGGGSLEMKLKYAAVGKPEEVVEKLNEAYKIGAYCVVLYPLSTNLKAQWERVKEILPSL